MAHTKPENEYWGAPRSVVFKPSHYALRLDQRKSKVLGDISEGAAITVLDILGAGHTIKVDKKRLTSNLSALAFFEKYPPAKTRFVSICSVNSIRPLGLPDDVLRLLFRKFGIHADLFDLVLSFGWKPRNCDAGAGALISKQRSGRTVETQYLITFPEAVQGPKTTDWTLRHVGIYHQYNISEARSLWILFHAKRDSDIQQALETELDNCRGILHVHVVILATHLKGWRWYLDRLNTEFDAIVDIAVTIDFTEPQAYQRGSNLLQKLQHFEDTMLPLVPRLKGTVATISELHKLKKTIPFPDLCMAEDYEELVDELTSFETQFKGYLESTEVLKERLKRTLDIMAVGLNLRNQTKGLGNSNTMLNLTKDAVEDNATVRVVTIVTLIYLPASFVASLLGTNLFSFQGSDGSGFQISKQFWIFIVVSIPLTVLTVGSLFYAKRRANMARKRNEMMELQQEDEKMC